MKKILTLALCLTAVGSLSAQKAVVDQASKLAGKPDKLEEARGLINQAVANPETSNDARTYFTAGKIEYDAFDKDAQMKAVNPDNPAVDLVKMGDKLVNGYNYFLKTIELEKGAPKAKFTKDAAAKVSAHHGDYFNMGGELFNNKHYYPEAYNAFMIYGDIAGQDWASKAVQAVPDSVVALAYHYAGIGAYSGNALPEALAAFEKARVAGITDPQNYVYEIATWQAIAQRDESKEEQAKKEIENVARHGYEKFGVTNPLFINNLVNSLLQQDRFDEAIALVSSQIERTPDKPFLYGLRAYVYDRKGDSDASVNDYLKAITFADADIETLKNASKKLYNHGVELQNALDGKDATKRAAVKADYFDKAKEAAERAQQLDPNDRDVLNILDRINYALENYFN